MSDEFTEKATNCTNYTNFLASFSAPLCKFFTKVTDCSKSG